MNLRKRKNVLSYGYHILIQKVTNEEYRRTEMAVAHVQIEITNIDEARKKAAELVETLEKAKDLIEQLNEMELIILNQNPTTT